jgi:hypothetical protein
MVHAGEALRATLQQWPCDDKQMLPSVLLSAEEWLLL